MQLPVWIIISYLLLSCTVSEIWRIIGPTFAYSVQRTHSGWTRKFEVAKFGLKKLSYAVKCFHILNLLGVTHECDTQTDTDGQTDGRTDGRTYILILRPRSTTLSSQKLQPFEITLKHYHTTLHCSCAQVVQLLPLRAAQSAGRERPTQTKRRPIQRTADKFLRVSEI